jgi:hypothetical protein
MSKGLLKSGKRKYGRWCTVHHKRKYGIPLLTKKRRKLKEVWEVSKEKCTKCGWGESYCDRHRIISGMNGGKYVKNNVIPLCPNCHRVEHNRKEDMKSPTQEENEELVKELLAEIEIACVPDLIHQTDWDKLVSIVIGDQVEKLINRVRDTEIEKATQVWSVYIEKMIGSVKNRIS